MDDDRSYLVQARAYEIWRLRGCQNGTHLENCAQAERELGAAAGDPPRRPPGPEGTGGGDKCDAHATKPVSS